MQQTAGQFSIGFYFSTLSKALGAPVIFFRELPRDIGLKQSAGFLIVSSVFFAGASLLTRDFPRPVLSGVIFFINAVGMTMIAAGTGYVLMTMIAGRKVTFRTFFSIYAFSSGIVMLAAWIPMFFWVTEPWKWLLIGFGLTKTCELRWLHAVLVIVISIAVIMLFFWSLMPVISIK